MKTPTLSCGIIRSAAGLAIGGTGLFRLFTHVLGATEQVTLALDQTAAARTQLLSWIMLASSLNTHRLGHDLFTTFWPLLPSVAGSVLLWSTESQRSKRSGQPCAQWI